jgi:hypothetical protein
VDQIRVGSISRDKCVRATANSNILEGRGKTKRHRLSATADRDTAFEVQLPAIPPALRAEITPLEDLSFPKREPTRTSDSPQRCPKHSEEL